MKTGVLSLMFMLMIGPAAAAESGSFLSAGSQTVTARVHVIEGGCSLAASPSATIDLGAYPKSFFERPNAAAPHVKFYLNVDCGSDSALEEKIVLRFSTTSPMAGRTDALDAGIAGLYVPVLFCRREIDFSGNQTVDLSGIETEGAKGYPLEAWLERDASTEEVGSGAVDAWFTVTIEYK